MKGRSGRTQSARVDRRGDYWHCVNNGVHATCARMHTTHVMGKGLGRVCGCESERRERERERRVRGVILEIYRGLSARGADTPAPHLHARTHASLVVMGRRILSPLFYHHARLMWKSACFDVITKPRKKLLRQPEIIPARVEVGVAHLCATERSQFRISVKY